MRKYLTKIDWTNRVKHKTAECWSILKNETERIVDIFVPLKKYKRRSIKTLIDRCHYKNRVQANDEEVLQTFKKKHLAVLQLILETQRETTTIIAFII